MVLPSPRIRTFCAQVHFRSAVGVKHRVLVVVRKNQHSGAVSPEILRDYLPAAAVMALPSPRIRTFCAQVQFRSAVGVKHRVLVVVRKNQNSGAVSSEILRDYLPAAAVMALPSPSIRTFCTQVQFRSAIGVKYRVLLVALSDISTHQFFDDV